MFEYYIVIIKCLRNISANRVVDIISVCVGSGMW